MTRIALLSAAALIGAGTLASTTAEARGGGAIAAGIIGGLAAGALLGAAPPAPRVAPHDRSAAATFVTAPRAVTRGVQQYAIPISLAVRRRPAASPAASSACLCA